LFSGNGETRYAYLSTSREELNHAMALHVKSSIESFEYIISGFTKNKRIFYSRFGDGDVYIMMGRDQANHKVSRALTNEMIESFQIRDPLYLKGLAVNHPIEKGMVRGLFAVFRANTEMQAFLDSKFEKSGEHLFESPVFLHYMSVFYPLKVNYFLQEVIRPKRKMFIGSIPKEKIEQLVGIIDYYIETPSKNAYETIDIWWPLVVRDVAKVELVIPAAGMATRVINKRLWELRLEIQSFDIGSLVDVADARQSRKWIRLAGHRIERHILRPNQVLSIGERIWYWRKEINLKFYSFIKATF